jgi:hypothetical protein
VYSFGRYERTALFGLPKLSVRVMPVAENFTLPRRQRGRLR